jgi:hypothetical protein
VALLERQHFVAPPAEGVRDGHGDLQIRRQVTPHRLEGSLIHEAGSRRGLRQLHQLGHAREAVVLVGEPQHLAEHAQFAVDRPVRRTFALASARVGFGPLCGDGREAVTPKEGGQVREAPVRLREIPRGRFAEGGGTRLATASLLQSIEGRLYE